MFRELFQRLQRLITGTDVKAPQIGIQIDRLKVAKLSRAYISKIINTESIEKSIRAVELPANVAQLYRSVATLYHSVPEIYQAVQILIDNVLSPDNITKRSIRIITHTTQKQEQETLDKLVNTIITELDLEDLLDEICLDFILFGNAYVEIENHQGVLKKYKLLETLSSKRVDIDIYIPEYQPLKENIELPEDIYQYTDQDYRNLKPVLQYLDLKLLPVENVVPIYIENILIGAIEILKRDTPMQVTGKQTTRNTMKAIEILSNEIAKAIHNSVVKGNEDLKRYVRDSGDLASIIARVLKHVENIVTDTKAIRFIPGEYIVHFRIPSTQYKPFGEPYITGILNHAKFLLAAEYAQIIYRLTRAPERRVFRINIGADRRASKYIEEVVRETKKKEFAVKTGSVDALINEVTMFEDYYIPVQEGEPTLEIDALPGGDLTSRIEDLEYFRKKVISGLGIPPIYLIQEESSESKYTLAQENIKFARTIIRLQKLFSQGLNSLLLKLFTLLFGTPELIEKVELQLKPPKAIQMEREAEILQNLSTIVGTLKDIAGNTLDVDAMVRDYLLEIFDSIHLRDYKLEVQAQNIVSGDEEETEV